MDDFDLVGISTDIPPAAFRWDLLNDDEHLTQSRDLARFVDWLIGRYRLQRQIPPCWWQHGPHVEELSALFVAWRGVMETPEQTSAWTGWHAELGRMVSRCRELWATGCTLDHHATSPVYRPQILDALWAGVTTD